MNYPTGTWQELNWYPAYSSDDFWNFCSNITNLNAPESITSVDYKLAAYTGGEPWTGLGAYADYFQKVIIPLCESGRIDSTDPGCFNTQNGMKDVANSRCSLTCEIESYWADITNSAGRSYLYSSKPELRYYR